MGIYISFTPKNLNSIFSQDEETLNNTHLSFNKRQTQHIQNVISTPLSHTSNPFPSSTRSSKGKCCEQRKMMKAEVEDAFRVRKWVVIFLVGFAISGVGLLLMIGWWVLGFWRNWEARVDGTREL